MTKIILCDDDKGITEMLEMVIDFSVNAETYVINDSIRAYDFIIKTKPDILIIDLWMPVVGGDEIIRNVRNHPEGKDIHIISISASPDGKEVALAAGADVFFPKPFDVEDIITELETEVSR